MSLQSPKMMLVALVSTLVQLGIAVIGWGGFTPFFAHPVRVALVVATLVLTCAAFFTKGNLSSGEREDRGNRRIFIWFTLLALALAYLPALTDRLDVWSIDGDATRWIGFAIFLGGGILRLWPVFVLGERFSGLVAIQKDHELVTTGVFRYIRNPSYLGLILGSLGWALIFRSWAGVIITALVTWVLIVRIDAEERLLAEQFGDAYADYRARTWRLVPKVY